MRWAITSTTYLQSYSCGDTFLAHRVGFADVGLLSLICFFLVLVSYILIGISVSQICSAKDKEHFLPILHTSLQFSMFMG